MTLWFWAMAEPGANAAVAACESGAKVLLVDKAPAGLEGGNTMASGQFIMATDDPDQLYTYLTTLMGKFQNWDDEAVRAYCNGCAENYDWMVGPMGGDPEIICPTEHPSAPMENTAGTKDSWTERENPWGIGRKGWVYCWQEFPEYESGKHCLCLTASGARALTAATITFARKPYRRTTLRSGPVRRAKSC